MCYKVYVEKIKNYIDDLDVQKTILGIKLDVESGFIYNL